MTKDVTLPTASTTLAELLNMGAQITFNSGRSLRGDLRDRYIHVRNEFGGLGVWDLDGSSGIDDAVRDLANDAAESGYDLHGRELPDPDDHPTR
ncbi:hypothetical protein [Sphingomonas sp. 3-13AW]|uniref:hypothetical protein n=1 Tax=Sphingomonas sp. 3-13AW TaxID=3050450 RepID=UPI003BB4ECD9